ncbi:hypothetical protein TcWFU_010376 [Taenia crassiceps]|uniref:Uncharacterized protein n=1 Tax=Taenia crassiceps TaxID=6207 RepID=A0ABR4QJE8_9CEST
MGTSGYSTSVTSSAFSGAGLNDILAQPPITTHLKLIELSEALAAHNASAAAALRSTNQEPVTSVSLHHPLPVLSRGLETDASGGRERRKSSTTSRYLISGPLPPPPPPPPPSAVIT